MLVGINRVWNGAGETVRAAATFHPSVFKLEIHSLFVLSLAIFSAVQLELHVCEDDLTTELLLSVVDPNRVETRKKHHGTIQFCLSFVLQLIW